jgi:anti-sigma B factor antagonist
LNRQASIEIKQTDDICIIRITGRLATGADEGYIDSKALDIKRLGCRQVIADLSELESVGSAGLGLFVDLHSSVLRRSSESNPGRFVLSAPTKRVLDVLKLTGLTRIIPVTQDLESALKLCGAAPGKVRTAGSSQESWE